MKEAIARVKEAIQRKNPNTSLQTTLLDKNMWQQIAIRVSTFGPRKEWQIYKSYFERHKNDFGFDGCGFSDTNGRPRLP